MPDPSRAGSSSCQACPRLAARDPAPRDRIVATAHWNVAHAFNANLEGWLVVIPRRHVEALDELDAKESAELGTLLVEVSRALRATTGCVKTYVLLLAEAEGFQHVHFHVVPRSAELPQELSGPRIFGLLNNPVLDVVSPERMDKLALDLRQHLELAGVGS
jgi:diadenosine tetraphosphate (Ap4A) HIT family hydrolase